MARRNLFSRSLAVWVLLSAVATISSAQFAQYTSPGSLAQGIKPRREAIEEGWEDARWQSGGLRLDPRFSIRNVGYVDNALSDFEGTDQISDLHLTIGAGLAAYWRLGTNVYATAFAAPEYNWWQDLDSLRSLGVSGGAGVHAFLNRLSLSIDARSTQEERPLNAEFEVPVLISEDAVSASLELDLVGLVNLVAGVSTTETQHGDELDELIVGFQGRSLDRDVERLRAGLGFEIRNGLEITLGLEELTTDFLVDPLGRSSSGTNPFVDVRFRGNVLSADLSAVSRDLDFDGPEDPAIASGVTSFDGTTGLFRVAFDLQGESGLSFYGSRNLVYSALDDSSYFTEERFGGAIQIGIRPKLSLQLVGEFGDAKYADLEMSSDRVDDFSSFGGGLLFELGPMTDLRLSAFDTRYDSNQPQFDRSTSRIEFGIIRGNALIPY